MVPIYLPTAIMGFTRKLIINFVNEKKEKYKEYQKVFFINKYKFGIVKNYFIFKINGLNNNAYIMGWMATSYLTGLIVNYI